VLSAVETQEILQFAQNMRQATGLLELEAPEFPYFVRIGGPAPVLPLTGMREIFRCARRELEEATIQFDCALHH